EQAVLDKLLRGDEQRVARERREALVGRVPEPGGSQREYLPQRLARAGQEIHERVRGGPQIAAGGRPRQCGGMEQQSARTREAHALRPPEGGREGNGA